MSYKFELIELAAAFSIFGIFTVIGKEKIEKKKSGRLIKLTVDAINNTKIGIGLEYLKFKSNVSNIDSFFIKKNAV